jgi:hypothetical protein
VGSLLALLVVGGVAVWAALRLGLDDAAPSSERFALSPQECNTECQSRQTDCIDDCEGNVPCERRCLQSGLACLERCKRLGADAGVGGAGGNAGGAAGRGASGAGGAAAGGTAGGREGTGGG